eukprot:TRINITY_DN2512_c0_g1_i2.p1 TRINITY_DN2512_c0_g1~~TRINITY_DN2512_c0_g1_i2.p1  ORF type:complete len:336 (+),score=-32.48 TRINITY_DN2512_c0_g1_i2:172-1179(+)
MLTIVCHLQHQYINRMCTNPPLSNKNHQFTNNILINAPNLSITIPTQIDEKTYKRLQRFHFLFYFINTPQKETQKTQIPPRDQVNADTAERRKNKRLQLQFEKSLSHLTAHYRKSTIIHDHSRLTHSRNQQIEHVTHTTIIFDTSIYYSIIATYVLMLSTSKYHNIITKYVRQTSLFPVKQQKHKTKNPVKYQLLTSYRIPTKIIIHIHVYVICYYMFYQCTYYYYINAAYQDPFSLPLTTQLLLLSSQLDEPFDQLDQYIFHMHAYANIQHNPRQLPSSFQDALAKIKNYITEKSVRSQATTVRNVRIVQLIKDDAKSFFFLVLIFTYCFQQQS